MAKRPSTYRPKITNPATHPYPLTKEEVASLYYERRLSLPEVAKIAGTSRQRLSRWMQLWGLPRRTSIEGRSIFTERRRASRPPGWIGHQWKHEATKTMFAYSPEHPRSRSNGCVAVHILVAEHRIGRYLEDGEVVHHLDRDRYNNAPANLCVMTSREHRVLHSLLGEIGIAMLAGGRSEEVARLIPNAARRNFVRLVYVDLVPCATGRLDGTTQPSSPSSK